MKVKKLIFLSLIGSLPFLTNAQSNSVIYTTGNSTIDGNSSIHIGTNAGNGSLTTGGNNLFVGMNAGNINTSGQVNTFLGNNTGLNNTTGNGGVFIGVNAGFTNSSGIDNVFIGVNSGFTNQTGQRNTFSGVNSGYYNTGSDNSFYGYMSGFYNTTGINNTCFGFQAGVTNTTGSGNTYLGRTAGYSNIGSGNVFIGNTAGYSETSVSNRLIIDNSSTSSPLIWGDFNSNQLRFNGAVGIGLTAPFATAFPALAAGVTVSSYNLFVQGGILTEELRISKASTTWADYVFEDNYNLKPLSEVEAFISKYNHLPNVPSAKQVKEEGINVADMARIQQEKIEELTLYLIQQNKEIEDLKAQMKLLLMKKQ